MMSICAVLHTIAITHNARSLRRRYSSRLSVQSTIEKCIERLDNGVRIVTRSCSSNLADECVDFRFA